MYDPFRDGDSVVDVSKPVQPQVIAQVKAALDQHGILVFRKTEIMDVRVQIDFGSKFGPLDDMEPHIKAGRKMRLPDKEVIDVINLDADGSLVTELDPQRLGVMKGNALWHSDLAFNAPRAYISILRAPPAAATTSMPAHHTTACRQQRRRRFRIWLNRKFAAPDIYMAIEPRDIAFSRHKLVVQHSNGCNTLYITSYIYHIDGWDSIEETDNEKNEAATEQLLDELFAHTDQSKYTYLMPWKNDTDLIMWDYTAVLHRATGSQYLTKHVRDMRRTTSNDAGEHGIGRDAEPFRQRLPIAKS